MRLCRHRSPLWRVSLHFSLVLLACSSPDAPLRDGDDPLGSEPSSEPSGAGSGEGSAAGGNSDGEDSAGADSAGADGEAPGAAGAGSSADPSTGAAPAGAEGTLPVRLRFAARVGTEPFACGTTYRATGGEEFTPADLRLFVQDVALIDGAGVEQPVALDVRAPWQIESVGLIDFEDASGRCIAGTRERNVELTGRVPAGDYRGIAFSNGVPEALNHADPSQLPPPLQAGSMSWGWLSGYRFLMAEVAGSGAVGDAAAAGSALLHVGSTACSGSTAAGIACSKSNRNRVRLDDFEAASDAIVIDLGELFGDMDLGTITTCHSSGEDCAALFARIGLDLESGSPSDGQRIYRVEPASAVEP